MSVRPVVRSEPQFWVNVEAETGEQRVLLVDPPGRWRETLEGTGLRVLSFAYTDSERKADTLTLTVDNFDLRNFDDPCWKKGNVLRVAWGYAGRLTPARELVVTKVSGFQQLTIEAQARSVVMNRETRNRTWTNVRRSDAVRQIAQENGWENVDIEDTVVVHETICQSRLTDAQFVQRLARAEGFAFFVDFDGFHFHSRRTGERPVRRFRYYTDPGIGEVISVSVDNDVTARPGRVRVEGRNPLEGEDVDGEAGTEPGILDSLLGGGPSESTAALAPVYEIIDPETRSSRTTETGPRRTIAARGAPRTPTESHEGNVAQAETRPTTSTSTEQVAREARSRQRRHQQTAVKLKLGVVGDPEIYAKTVVQIDGIGRRLSLRYYVTEVSHTIDSGGYKTVLSCISDGSGGHATSSTVAEGLELVDPGPANTARRNRQDAPEEGAENEDGAGDAAPTEPFERVDPETRRSTVTYQQPQRTIRRGARSEQPGRGASPRTGGGS